MGNSPDNPNRPKVAIIATSLPPYRIHFHQRIVREMPEIELVTICTHEDTDSRWRRGEAPTEINPVHFGMEPNIPDVHGYFNPESFKKGGRIIQWLSENKVSAVVSLGYSNICRLRIIRWCKANKIPCFLFGDSNIREDTASGLTGMMKSIVLGWAIKKTAGQFPCGSLGKAYFEKYGASPDRIIYMPYEPDYEQIQNLPEERIEAIRAQYHLPKERRRIVFSGRFAPVKQPELLMKAYIEVAKQRHEWDLIMIGDGPMNEELRGMVPFWAKSRVIWTGFLYDQSEISALYRASDVLALPSKIEPWALVVNEAAAAGMAIVASDVVGSAAELVQDSVNGRIFPTGNLEELTHRLLDVTTLGRTDSLKSQSKEVLAEWRRKADPVEGLRKGLAMAGVVGAPSAS